ncbi:hypothetical protein INQ23_28280, partial [Escherichia coli]|nr:hypothetical protein [Escherichia coli]
LTLAGIQGAGGGWTVNGGALTLGANAKVDVTGTGVTLADGGTSITIINGGALIGNAGNGVVATADTSVTNGGMIRSHGTSYAGVTT